MFFFSTLLPFLPPSVTPSLTHSSTHTHAALALPRLAPPRPPRPHPYTDYQARRQRQYLNPQPFLPSSSLPRKTMPQVVPCRLVPCWPYDPPHAHALTLITTPILRKHDPAWPHDPQPGAGVKGTPESRLMASSPSPEPWGFTRTPRPLLLQVINYAVTNRGSLKMALSTYDKSAIK